MIQLPIAMKTIVNEEVLGWMGDMLTIRYYL
jgi:hypothetical protein